MTLTARFKAALGDKAMTKTELARVTGIPEGTIRSAFKKGQWRPEDAISVADMLELQGLPRDPEKLREAYPDDFVTRKRRIRREIGAVDTDSPRAVYLQMANQVFARELVFVSWVCPPERAVTMRVVVEPASRSLLRDLLLEPAGERRFTALTVADGDAAPGAGAPDSRPIHATGARARRKGVGGRPRARDGAVPGLIWGYLMALGMICRDLDESGRSSDVPRLIDNARGRMRFLIADSRPVPYPWFLNPAIRLLAGFRCPATMDGYPTIAAPTATDRTVVMQMDGASLSSRPLVDDDRFPVVRLASERLINELCVDIGKFLSLDVVQPWQVRSIEKETLLRIADADYRTRSTWIEPVT